MNFSESQETPLLFEKLEQAGYKAYTPVTPRIDSFTTSGLEAGLNKFFNDPKAPVFKIVINLAGVEFISHAGFRAFLAAQRTAKRYNRGEIILANPSERIKEALDISGFSEVLRTEQVEFPKPQG